MIINSPEQYTNLFKSRSRILNRIPPNPKSPPKFFDCLDLSPSGVEGLIRERTELLLSYREQVRAAIAEWKAFCVRQLMPQASKPISHYAEKINYAKGRVGLYEAELRALHAMQTAHKKQAAAKVAAMHHHPKGIIKFKNGVPHSCDGRALLTDEKDVVAFVDTGEELQGYLQRLKLAKRERLTAEKTAQSERHARVQAARANPAKPQR